LVHHVRTHAEENTVQIACLCSVAENLRPAGFFELRFSFNGSKDFLKLTDDFGIVVGLVEEAGDGVFSLW
jgi:hypothetical protein